ncbi:ABC transporter ATP-binding protein [Komagataeibacter rhaeticus]|uniref:ABC transporter ATP-binding protein n=1 Tax=Komagataeibacter rhaeticus TaxID=215221 RepID=UPI0004DA4851|nr:ABC transporter ATP-binding protein [Komagataeibacter rhaeticus]KDU95283.1 ABC transporter [Komagataeibacter rhaeticus AF1]MBL7240957.1 ABC transporter ATP-binding protein [Komagataeibacter rhaeticus]PYD53967.1 ABC transporter ATP-binding protein [Komagataeibacter rhaeticus]GBQ17505.1 ferrichrome ABC transporter ATP-binding protein [Komagataeibacter rhaeticus DSM 16663]
MSGGAGALLRMDHAGFHRGRRGVLHDLSFSINRGELVALLGPNGAGKTTLLRLLLGLVPPGSGQVWLEGRPMATWSRREIARRIAYVPQGHVPLFPYSVRDIVGMGRLAETPFAPRLREADRDAVAHALGALAITHLADRAYTDLSGGERQAVLLARALAQGAAILVLDEPETGLDYGQKQRLYVLLRRLAGQGHAVIATTHDPIQAACVFDRAILLRHGHVMADGPAAALLGPAMLERLYAPI